MKLNKILIALSAGALLVAGCQQMEKVTVKLGDSTPPVIVSSNVTPDMVTVNYDPAVMVVGTEPVKPTMIVHTLAIVKVTKDETVVETSLALSTEDNPETKVVKLETSSMANVLVGLGFQYGDKVDLVLKLRAQLSTEAHSGYLDSEGTINVDGYTIKKPVSRGGRYAEFDKTSTWGVTGSIASAGISWDKDIAMYTNGKWHVAEGVTLTASEEFKFRKDGKWDENLGAAEGITENLVVTLDVEQDAGPNGKNLQVPEDSKFDLYLNPVAKKYKVTKSTVYPDLPLD